MSDAELTNEDGRTFEGYFVWLNGCTSTEDMTRDKGSWMDWSRRFRRNDTRAVAMHLAFRWRWGLLFKLTAVTAEQAAKP